VTFRSSHELDVAPWKRIDGTIMETAKKIRKAYDDVLAPLALTLPEASLLAFINESEPMTQIRLSECLGSGRAALGSRVDALERRGAVERRPDLNDRRVWLVHITEVGRSLVDDVTIVDRALRDQLRQGISREERQQLAAVLLRLQANLAALRTES
jgi:MarR family transcriptional regulator, transcriptional regulator for hemolysin